MEKSSVPSATGPLKEACFSTTASVGVLRGNGSPWTAPPVTTGAPDLGFVARRAIDASASSTCVRGGSPAGAASKSPTGASRKMPAAGLGCASRRSRRSWRRAGGVPKACIERRTTDCCRSSWPARTSAMPLWRPTSRAFPIYSLADLSRPRTHTRVRATCFGLTYDQPSIRALACSMASCLARTSLRRGTSSISL